MPLGQAQTNLPASPTERVHIPSQTSPISLLPAFVERQPPKSPFIAKPCVCSANKRRRGSAAGSSRSSRRNRHCPRMDCPLVAFQSPASFDRLPWISAMEITPDQLDPCDIADLSQLPVQIDASTLGPIRRRKTSLRSTPFPPLSPESPSSSSHSLSPSHFISHDFSTRDPRTPPRDTIPLSQIQFRNLMPCFDQLNESPRTVSRKA